VWLISAAAMALLGGRRWRRAASQGVLAVALASAVTNLALKPLADRRRPAGPDEPVPDSRRVRRPGSPSFPSGHAASASAFASAAGQAAPGLWLPLHAAAATVAFSRVHTGVHYTSDVVVGAMVGDLCGQAMGRLATRLPRRAGTRRTM
jgi:undecaprenyl-diphosphatase